MAGWAAKIRTHAASKQPRARKPRPVVRTIWAQTRPPNEETGDPGAVIDIRYTVEDGVVTLMNEKGTPIGGEFGSYVLQPGERAERIASRLGLVGRDLKSVTPPTVAWVV